MIMQPKKNKVCIITSIHPAFDTRIFHKQAASLAAAGYETTLVAPHAADETVNGVFIKALPEPNSRLSRFLSLWRPWQIALRASADVYHFHDPDLLIVGLLLKLFKKTKVIYDVHEDVPRDILSKEWIPKLLRAPIGMSTEVIEKISARFFDSIVAATPAIGQRFPLEKTSVIQNMPLLGEFALSPTHPYKERLPIVCYVGSITRIRGAMEMVEAITCVSQKTNVKFVVAGDFYPAELEQRMRERAPMETVEFLGRQNRAQVSDILNKSRIGLVILHPVQSHLESQPTKLFEYMAAGIPVVASDFPLWRKIITQNRCGLLVDPLDPVATSQAINRLLENPQEAEAMGERGRQAIVSQYNWDYEAKKLLALYKDLIA